MASSKGKNKKIVGLVLIFILLALFALTVYFTLSFTSEIRGKNVSDDFAVVTVEKGDSISVVGEKLKESGIINYPAVFKLYGKFCGKDGNIQIGSFELKKGEGYENIYEALSQSRYRESVTITFPEGYTVSQMIKLLVEKGVGTEAGYRKAIAEDYFPYDYLPPAGTENRLEGFLYPDTYAFFVDDNEHNVLNKLLSRFNDIIEKNDIKSKLGEMSLYDAVTLASIVQMEGGIVSDFPKISSVFHNRMEIGMLLQSCATIVYVLPESEKKAVLTMTDLKTESPYNTYLYKGLTPTPISNPGIEALKAAVSPEDTEYLYFVAKFDGKGGSAFAVTYAEHQRNCKKYLG